MEGPRNPLNPALTLVRNQPVVHIFFIFPTKTKFIFFPLESGGWRLMEGARNPLNHRSLARNQPVYQFL